MISTLCIYTDKAPANRDLQQIKRHRVECDTYMANLHSWNTNVYLPWALTDARARSGRGRWTQSTHAPACDVPKPECVQWYIEALKKLPIAQRVKQCRTGHNGHPGLMLALKLVSQFDKDEFDAWDVAVEAERVASSKIELQKQRVREETGPNGETKETHVVQVDIHPGGGRGQTQQVRTWHKLPRVELDGADSD